MNWPLVDFQDVVFFQEGPGVRKWQFRSEGIKLINVKNIVNENLCIKNSDKYLDVTEVNDKYSHFLCDEGDLVMASSGATWGKTAWVSKTDLPLCMNTSMIRFKSLDSEKLCKYYLRRYLQTDLFKNQMNRLITGSAQPNFGPSHLKQIKIPLPPLSEQKRIAAILDKADAIRRKRQQAIDLADDFLRSVFLDMFGDPVTNPKGWEVYRMGDVIDFKGGHQPPKDTFIYEPKEGYVRLIQIRDFKSDKYLTYIPEAKAKRHFEKDDVMIARYGPPVFQILRGLEGSYNVALMKAIPKGKILKSFIYYLLQVPAYHDVVVANSERTAGQTGVNLDLLNNFSLPLPPVSEQEKIIKTMTKMEIAMKRFNKHGVCADDLFNSLSQKAFAGEL